VEFKEQYYPPFLRDAHTGDKYITNDCDFDKNMIITGVNASGKTTILKTTTINIIFSQQIGCGFYTSCSLCPYTHIHSYLNIPDTSGRDSLFQAESRRCKEILDIIGTDKKNTQQRHFCIFDELYSGTNPIEATKSAYAFLLYLSEFNNVDFILTTHYTSICTKFQKSKRIRNYKMDVERTEKGNLIYKYKIRPGICQIQGAIDILKSMDYPAEILDTVRNYKDNLPIKKAVRTP
jgi:DNA mismatch repair ATPase MutS